MKNLFLITGLLCMATSVFAQQSKSTVVIVPRNGDTQEVIQALKDKGIAARPGFKCPKTATLIKVTPISNSNKLLLECLSPSTGSPRAISRNSKGGDPNSLLTEAEGNAQSQGDTGPELVPLEAEEAGAAAEGAAGKGKKASSSLKFLGRVEQAARDVQAEVHRILLK